MLAKIKQWLKDRAEANKERLRLRGYDYAAGQLLRSGEVIIDLLYMEAANPFEWNAFDEGIVDAVKDFQIGKGKSDERLS